jgi:thioredoxin
VKYYFYLCSVKKKQIMKKLTFILFFFTAFSLSACNSGGAETSGNTGTSAEGEVVMLTAEAFQKLVWDYKKNPQEFVFKGDQPVIIDFYADWCRPCKMIAPIMQELAKEYKGKIKIYKVNTDQQRELAGLFSINSIPAVLFVPKEGKPQMSVGAMQKPGYVDAINNVLKVK